MTGGVPTGHPRRLELLAVEGIGEVHAGDDLSRLVLQALAAGGQQLLDGDVLVVSSKVVSKAEGRTVAAPTRDAAIDAETVRILAERVSPRGTTRVVVSRSGPVLAAAGVDASNVAPGTVLLLPVDPDASARALRHRLEATARVRVGVVVSDTAGRAWRDGQVDLAIGVAGLDVTDDLRGGTDGYGNPLEVTVRALADELASAADLVKGKLAGVPVALVRGLASLVTEGDGRGAASLLRGPGGDWFALGHVEAVRTALGVPPGTPGVESPPVVPDGATARLRRAVTVALAGPPLTGEAASIDAPAVEEDEHGRPRITLPSPAVGDPVAVLELGALVQRILAAAWSEGLTARASVTADAVRIVADPT